MKLIKKLYTEGLSNKKLNKINKKIIKNKPVVDIFVITLPIVHNGLLEIYYYCELMQSVYDGIRDDILVIGVTGSKEDAKNQVTKIVDDLFKQTGDFDIKSFVKELV